MNAALDTRSRRGGFSLIEVLVALVVLSVGLLGLAALQAEGLRGSGSALVRFQATRLMSDISDRMRANRAGLDDYVVTAAGSGVASHQCSEVGSTVAQDCSAEELAEYELFLWKRDIGELLPSGTGAIAASPGSTDRYLITIAWTERAEAMTMTTEVQF